MDAFGNLLWIGNQSEDSVATLHNLGVDTKQQQQFFILKKPFQDYEAQFAEKKALK